MKHSLIFALCAVLLSSCSTYQRLAYLKDMEVGKEYLAQQTPEARIHTNDRLKILVTAQNAALAAPFNMIIGTENMLTVEEALQIRRQPATDDMRSYIVEGDGCINFPVLGRVPVEGLTLEQMKSRISRLIIESGYVKDPIVLASFQNFKIIMLSAYSASVLNVADGSISIFEALASGVGNGSGDGGSGNRSNTVRNDVRVIRTENGVKKAYSINLQSVSCFQSPVYYLQQNDMVYFRPRNRYFDDIGNTVWYTGVSALMQILSSTAAIYYFTRR